MFFYLLLLFTILPALELAVLIHVGAYIGAGNTILLIILTGIAGAYLARIQGFVVLRNIQTRLRNGMMPTEEMFDGAMIFVGGILLLTPGFITDILGFLLLIPGTRSLIKYLMRKKVQQWIKEGSIVTLNSSSSSSADPKNFEDAEFYE